MNNSDIIAIASLVVATLALFSTAWQAWLMRHHSRLSVKPLLVWSTHRDLDMSAFTVTATLQNKGLGPAIVVERYFVLDGQHFEPPERDVSAVESLVAQLVPNDWHCRVRRQGLPGVGSAILPNDVICIAQLAFDSLVFDYAAELVARMERVEFVVVFEDLYGNRFVFRTA